MVRRTATSKDKRPSQKRLTVVSYGKDDAKIVSSSNEEASPTNRVTSGSKIVFKGKFAQQRLDALAKQRREKDRASKSPGSRKQRMEEQKSSSDSSSAADAQEDVSSSSDDSFTAPSPKRRPAGLPVVSPKKTPARSSRISRPGVSASQTPKKRPRKNPASRIPQGLKIRQGETKALAEIRYFQSQTGLCIPKLSFQRVVRELTHRITGVGDLRYASDALEVLQESAETFMTGFFEDSYLLSMHAKRVTLMPQDMKLAARIRRDSFFL